MVYINNIDKYISFYKYINKWVIYKPTTGTSNEEVNNIGYF